MSNKFDAVLPITLKDLERAKILLKTCSCFFEDLETLWIVVPDKAINDVKTALRFEKVEIIGESDLVPEFRIHRFMEGWFKQQLIKLAIAERITNDFYITLDADVLCVQKIKYEKLIENGRAICQIALPGTHEKWYSWAEKVLEVGKSDRRHGVTPAVISREAVLSLFDFLKNKTNPAFQSIAKVLPEESLLRNYLQGHRGFLARSLPWTEYALYYTFLEAMNLFDTYHVAKPPESVYSNCIWWKDRNEFGNWEPIKSFGKDANFFFSIIQSNTDIMPEQILHKIEDYIN